MSYQTRISTISNQLQNTYSCDELNGWLTAAEREMPDDLYQVYAENMILGCTYLRNARDSVHSPLKRTQMLHACNFLLATSDRVALDWYSSHDHEDLLIDILIKARTGFFTKIVKLQ